jgi:tetratricopeptide (TPR) repeat protein
MRENLVSRAQLLMQQQRFSDAEKILASLLSNYPEDLQSLTLMAEIKIQQGHLVAALQFIDRAISQSPDFGFLFYLKARVMLQSDRYDEAEDFLKESTILEPEDADFFALWASVKLNRKKFDEALILSGHALELDPENILALNIRSTALLKLNRNSEALETIEGALHKSPDNPHTHANFGWNLLEKGEPKKALEHFKNALKFDPNNEYAQAGMAEALKARYFLYKLFLKYSFWISNLTEKYQWGVIVGFYLGFKFIRLIAEQYKSLQPILYPLIGLLFVIAFSTWIITPVSNLFLRLNKYGKHLLDEKEKLSSNFVAGSAALFFVGIFLFLVFNNSSFLTIAAFGLVMMIPFSVMFSPTKYKNSLKIYASLMFLVGLIAIITAFASNEPVNVFSLIFIFGAVGFQWVANFLLIKEGNK